MGIFYGPAAAQQALRVDDRWSRRIGMVLLALIIAFVYQGTPFRTGEFMLSVLISLGNVICYWEGNRQISIRYNLRYPDYSQISQRLIRQFFAVTLYSLALSLLIHFTFDHWVHRLQGGTIFPLQHSLFLGLGLTYVALAFYEAINFFQRWKSSVIEQERLQVAQARSELESLKNQVNPHFLFNSLNTLTALIPRDQDKATTFVRHLSQVYRYVLEVPATQPVSLDTELQFLADYLFLMRTRHGQAIQVRMDIPATYQEALMVPLALQILVENAVKHNVVSMKYPLQLEIQAAPEGLTVRNNRRTKAGEIHSTGLGLANLRSRYLLMGQQVIQVRTTEASFEVLLPWIEKAGKPLERK